MQVNEFSINSINIKNYKKYENLSVSFKKKFMLLIGENGSGKTSALEAIATMLGGYLQTFKNIPSQERHSIGKSDIRLEMKDVDDVIVATLHTPVEISGKFNINGNEISTKRTRDNANPTTMTKLLKSNNEELISIVKQLESSNESLYPIISYHGTGRLWEQDYKRSSKMENLERLYGYKDCLNAKSNYRNFIAWFEKNERHSFSIRKEIPTLEAVRNIVKQMIQILTGKEVELFIYREGDLEIKFVNEEKREKVSILSDGYRNMIGMVSDIAYRMAVLNPQLGIDVAKHTSGVVLIDEIDLHLHPKWQREIVHILTSLFPKVQFIATSHSPFIIQSQEAGHIIKLDELATPLSMNGTEMSIEDIVEDIQKIDLPQMSKRKIDMLEVAKEYLGKLELLKHKQTTQEEVDKIKNKLDELIVPFEDNMAYVAFLERKRFLAENNL